MVIGGSKLIVVVFHGGSRIYLSNAVRGNFSGVVGDF